MGYQLTYKRFGEHSILVEWPSVIDESILYDVLSFKTKIEYFLQEESIQVNHAYNTLLVGYDSLEIDFTDKIETIKKVYRKNTDNGKQVFRLWKIPVCYDVDFGIDIVALASLKKLSVQEIIKLHSQSVYMVYFIGFLPGFLYLGGLDELLYTPRKATPRLRIEKGAVAIGGGQTGVYPNESPGGWNVIGNSPIDFFNIKNESPSFASAGDRIQFYPVSKKEHLNIKTLVEAGVFQIESEVIRD
ncbi:5-oxoprolinase subunit PxpB [Seonamhaeicola maritimus]|uniref:5-oxoprolinase subunit PxpB n=1 Tax=Seonamhaeicola maritimus TaxID=2591822 RepID=UPI00249445E4|nr:5-oxoprolinase subunit PxpB [Seonamhaeicola maritimus]